MEQTQGVPAGASSAESPCQFAIDGGGNLYRRYSEPVCASCVPVMKLTDKWESARVADFNAGWNACRNAMLSAAPQAQPAAGVQAKGMVEQASNCKKPFFAHDPENGTEWFATEADAIAYARASLAYYQDWAQSDGEWSGDVEHVKIGRVTHIASESGNEEDGYNYSIRPLAAEATPSPAPAQAQPVEAEQAPAPVPELPPIDPGWTFNHARPKAGESGVWEIGFYDDEDDLFSPIVTVDTGLEYCKEGAEPLANAILARLAAQAPTVAPTQPSQPVREPMSWDLFVAACEAEYGEEFCPNNLGDVSDEEKAELMRVVSIVERHHGIGSKGGAESDVLGQGSQS